MILCYIENTYDLKRNYLHIILSSFDIDMVTLVYSNKCTSRDPVLHITILNTLESKNWDNGWKFVTIWFSPKRGTTSNRYKLEEPPYPILFIVSKTGVSNNLEFRIIFVLGTDSKTQFKNLHILQI